MIKSYKIRIHPTKEQENLMWKHINDCRYVWNYMLELQENRYAQGEKHLPAYDMIKQLTPLKNDGEHNWLYEVSNSSLQEVCKDLDFAYKEFFKKMRKHPKFKSRKKAKLSFPTRCNAIYFLDGRVNIERIGKVKYHAMPIYELPGDG